MVKYSCERCGKGFSQKSQYDSHNRRKTPCENNADKIKAHVDKAVEEKLKELNKKLIVENEVTVNTEVMNTHQSKKFKIKKKNIVELKLQKPFLKWVGGKTQIINDIISKIPNQMNNYHELFLGGGSVLLAVLSLQKQNKIVIKNKIYAYDINSVLINVYKNIQNHKEELYKFINLYIKEYDSIKGTIINRKPTSIEEAKTSKESYYYWIRNKYNNIEKTTIECSALFMFINKTCFRGMYREGPNGYNVPYGHYKKTPTIISETDLNYINDLIKNVEFKHISFTDSIKNVKEGDFVYLDPPYAPENANSFVGYVAGGFNLEMHKLLFSEIKKLGNIKFIMSNANVELVTDNFKEYNCDNIIARRAINSKKPGSTTTEVIIYN
jgi:DNA adenine methylase